MMVKSTPNRTIDADRLPAGYAPWQTAGHRERWASYYRD
jgi:hypothetical protein